MTDEEVPWYSSPPDAKIHWVGSDGKIGFLYFKSPKDGSNECIPITIGPSTGRSEGQPHPVWHIDRFMTKDIATVSPSIHGIGRFHSPNPVQFHITEITGGH